MSKNDTPEANREPGAVPPIPHPTDALVDHDPKNHKSKRPPASPTTPKSTRYDVGSNGGEAPAISGE